MRVWQDVRLEMDLLKLDGRLKDAPTQDFILGICGTVGADVRDPGCGDTWKDVSRVCSTQQVQRDINVIQTETRTLLGDAFTSCLNDWENRFVCF